MNWLEAVLLVPLLLGAAFFVLGIAAHASYQVVSYRAAWRTVFRWAWLVPAEMLVFWVVDPSKVFSALVWTLGLGSLTGLLATLNVARNRRNTRQPA